MKVIFFITDYDVVDRLALAHFELNLTSDDSRIYHYRRWDEANLAQEHSFRHRNKKAISYQFFFPADVRIVVGLVESHFVARVSGGWKGICPALMDKRTIEKFHVLEFPDSPSPGSRELRALPSSP
jgi:hypothetical protein